MVYKKYIKKDGKFYGPYVYHSRRVNGKVVSEYHGVKKDTDYKKFVLIFLGVCLFICLIYAVIFFSNQFSGNVVFDLNVNYQEEEPLDGTLKFSLKEGELIPASSKIIFENSGGKYSYNLEDVVSGELIEGDFYAEGRALTGSGLGYGVQGTKEVYPTVYFTLDVYSEKKSDSFVEETSGTTEANTEEAPLTTGIPKEGTRTSDEVTSENGGLGVPQRGASTSSPSRSERRPQDTELGGKESEEESGESNEIREEQENIDEVVEPEVVEKNTLVEQDEIPEEQEKEVKEEKIKDEKVKEEKEKEVVEEPEVVEDASITGNIVSRLFGQVFNFFLSLTGQVSIEFETEVQGEVSADKPFVYDLTEGQTAEILVKSVKTDDEELSDNVIKLDILENKVIVTTNYFKEENGFGEDYIRDKEKTLVIDLDKLDLIMEKGELKISLVYGEEEIISLTTLLETGNVKANKTTEEKKLKQINNKTKEDINPVEVNETMNKTIFSDITEILEEGVLSDREREILINEFGNVSIKRTAESINKKIVVKYELGKYWIKYAYDDDAEDLDYLMEVDKVKWLRDLIKTILQEESVPQKLENFTANYSL